MAEMEREGTSVRMSVGGKVHTIELKPGTFRAHLAKTQKPVKWRSFSWTDSPISIRILLYTYPMH